MVGHEHQGRWSSGVISSSIGCLHLWQQNHSSQHHDDKLRFLFFHSQRALFVRYFPTASFSFTHLAQLKNEIPIHSAVKYFPIISIQPITQQPLASTSRDVYFLHLQQLGALYIDFFFLHVPVGDQWL